MSTKVVSDGLIEHVVLYKPVFWLFRFDVFPFVVSYSVFFAMCMSTGTMQYIGLIVLPMLFAIHLFLFLLAQWSVKIRCRLGYATVTDVTKADTVHVIAVHNAGMDRLVKLLSNSYFAEAKKVRIMQQDFAITRERLDFQKVVYNFDTDKNSFVRLDYPSSAPVKQFLDWRGHGTPQDVGMSLMRWGTNEYDIPIPNFLDLYLVSHMLYMYIFLLCAALYIVPQCNPLHPTYHIVGSAPPFHLTPFHCIDRTIWWLRFSFSKCCACSCGVLTTTGITVCSRC